MANTISLHRLLDIRINEDHASSMDLEYNRKGIKFSIRKVDKNTNKWCLKIYGKGSTWSKLFTDYRQVFHYEIPIGILAEKRPDLFNLV